MLQYVMQKKFFCLIMVLMLVASLLLLTGCNRGVSSEDFLLTISVSETEVRKGENFDVTVFFENNTGKNLDIAVFVFLTPDMEGYGGPLHAEVPEHPEILSIRAYGNLEIVKIASNNLVGTHDLRYRAIFHLRWGRSGQQRIELWSNTLSINVI